MHSRLDARVTLMELRANGASSNEIANALGRTEAAIEQRAHILKRQAAAEHLWTEAEAGMGRFVFNVCQRIHRLVGIL